MIYGDEVRTNLTTSSRPGFLFRTSRDPGSAIWLCSGCGSGGRTASTASTVCTSVVSRCRVHYAFDASHLQITMYRQLDTGCECDVFEIFIPECPMRLYTRLHESCIITVSYRCYHQSSSHRPPYTCPNTHPMINFDLIRRARNPCLLHIDRLRFHGAH